MGIFGGIGRALKGINWDRVSAGLAAAGASSHGDHGTAAQIWGQYGQRRADQRQTQAEQQQRAQLEAAAVQMGLPEQQVRSLPTNTLAGVVGQRLGQQGGNEYTYFDDNAGNRWRQNSRTGEVDPNPSFIDRNPRQFIQDGQLITVPNSYAGGQPQQQQDQQRPFTFEMYRGAVNGLGQQGANDWLQRNGMTVNVGSPQEAQQLPPGTHYRTPDGREFVR